MAVVCSKIIEFSTSNFTNCKIAFGQASGGVNTDIEVHHSDGFDLYTNNYSWEQLYSNPVIDSVVGIINIHLSNPDAAISVTSNAEIIDYYYADYAGESKWAIVSISGDATLLIG